MQGVDIATVLVWTISLISILCMLVRPRGIAEVYWVCGGAILLFGAQLISPRQAAHAVFEGLDVYFFLIGMMILAELAREEQVFEWVADVAARQSQGSPRRLFILVYLIGSVVTAFLSNDATAVVLTPAVLAVVRRAKVDPKPHLLACALVANAASFVFPISNPANLVVFDHNIPPLGTWLQIFFVPSLASLLITFLCLRLLSRKELSGEIQGDPAPVALATGGKLAIAGLVLAATALIISSALGLSLGVPTCGAAVIAMAAVAWRDRTISLRVAKGVSWAILPLVAGLFAIVEALQNTGLFRIGIAGMQALAQTSTGVATVTAAFVVALLSKVMNNLPVGLMSGAAIRHAPGASAVADAIVIGVDLGPNLSVTGSLATITRRRWN